ncbi:hypothetical protein RvY_15125 [Ramazzottius varieornatus]|uniref:HTH psq-type domain-containing protein n=1 Tax=Ramazzottius varieornatus TaxID=947166 RepID=A0A1D1VTS9_RAMVA|nr:hypothetical protein RvY_15125 [Ramazzottius varieornatus]
MSQQFKTKRPRRYSEEDLKRALSAVENGTAHREAARLYNVPPRTIYCHLQDTKARRMGRGRQLNATEERLLVDQLKKFGNT